MVNICLTGLVLPLLTWRKIILTTELKGVAQFYKTDKAGSY